MSEWITLTSDDEPIIGSIASYRQLENPHGTGFDYQINADGDVIELSKQEALAFAALLPEVRALVEAASGIAVPFYGMLLKEFGSPDSWPSDRAGIIRYEALKAALAPFQEATNG